MAKGNLKNYWVKWGTLYIHYTSKESFQQYCTDEDENSDCDGEKDCWVQKIQCDYGVDDTFKYPHEMLIDDAEGHCVEYDDEDEEEKENEDEEKDEDEKNEKEKIEEKVEEKEEKVEEKEEKKEENTKNTKNNRKK